MKLIIYLLQKEFLQIFRNKAMLLIIFIVPVIQLIILVNAATYDIKYLNACVIDYDLSGTSRQLISKFEGSPFFHVQSAVFSLDEAENLLLKDQADIIIHIPNGFEKELRKESEGSIQLLMNAVNGMKGELGFSYALSVIKDFNQNIVADWLTLPDFKPEKTIDIKESYWYNPELDYRIYMAPGILAILVTIIGMFLAGMNMVREKEIGTIEQINVSPVKKHQLILSKLIPFWIIGQIELWIGISVAILFFNMPFAGNPLLLFGMASVYLFAALAIGLFISTLSDTQQQVMFISYFFLMIFVIMGGIFPSVNTMPAWALEVNRLNPVYYFIRIMRMVTLKGVLFHELLSEFLSLVTLGTVMLVLAVWRYKKVS